MNLSRLLNEIELLYRSEVRFGQLVRMVVADLVIDYLYSTFAETEPPIPVYPAYVWPEGVSTYFD